MQLHSYCLCWSPTQIRGRASELQWRRSGLTRDMPRNPCTYRLIKTGSLHHWKPFFKFSSIGQKSENDMCSFCASRFYIKSHEVSDSTSASAVKTCNLSLSVCSRRADRHFFSDYYKVRKKPKRRKMEFFNKIKMFVVSRVATLFY